MYKMFFIKSSNDTLRLLHKFLLDNEYKRLKNDVTELLSIIHWRVKKTSLRIV